MPLNNTLTVLYDNNHEIQNNLVLNLTLRNVQNNLLPTEK